MWVGLILDSFLSMNPRAAQSKEPTLKTVVSLIKQLGGSVNKMNSRLNGIDGRLDGVEDKLGAVSETVEFLKDNVLMKDDAATKSELADFKSEVIGHIDHFVQLHKKQEVELVAVAHHITRHEETFHKKS